MKKRKLKRWIRDEALQRDDTDQHLAASLGELEKIVKDHHGLNIEVFQSMHARIARLEKACGVAEEAGAKQ